MYSEQQNCNVCEKEFTAHTGSTGLFPDAVCSKCKEIEADKKRADHFRELDQMDVLKRIRLVEKFIYNYKLEPYKRPFEFRSDMLIG